jgi:predicted Zn-dependent protease
MKLPPKMEMSLSSLAGSAMGLRTTHPITAKHIEDAAAELRAFLSEQIKELGKE